MPDRPAIVFAHGGRAFPAGIGVGAMRDVGLLPRLVNLFVRLQDDGEFMALDDSRLGGWRQAVMSFDDHDMDRRCLLDLRERRAAEADQTKRGTDETLHRCDRMAEALVGPRAGG